MTLAEIILAGLLSLPTHGEDRDPSLIDAKRGQLAGIAEGIAAGAERQRIATSRDWAALVVAIGFHESGYSLRIGDGHCKPLECDRGRARGPFQVHRYAEAVPVWEQMHGLEHVAVQARVASARLVRGYYTCRGAADWLIATVNGFAGVRCGHIWPGLEQRAATWRAVRGAMARAERKAKAGT